ncbi:MAG: Sir2 family NAD-dependent protein deacetylase [Miltoncostaeaceae bacterium]
MSGASHDPEALAAALLGAEHTVVLAGPRLDPEGIAEIAARRGEWAHTVDLDTLLTRPAQFWESFLPIARAAHDRLPGDAQRALARLQSAGAVDHVVTQAVDGLLQRAGVRDVVEVYGDVLTVRCERCGAHRDLDEAEVLISGADDGVPRCPEAECAYPLRPSGSLWNEALPAAGVERAWDLAAECDLLVVIDSDLRTVPISLLPSVPLTRGAGVVLIGPEPTRYDRYARMVVRVPSSAPTLRATADLISPSRT